MDKSIWCITEYIMRICFSEAAIIRRLNTIDGITQNEALAEYLEIVESIKIFIETGDRVEQRYERLERYVENF